MSYKYRYLNAEMPEKKEVLEKTPNPASRELLSRLEEAKVETYLERFETQQPQCRFGLTGVCCQRCLWGPCRVGSSERPRGICGADANLVIAGNLLRFLAAGCAAHGTHALQIAETLLSYAENETDCLIRGTERLKELTESFALEGADLPSRMKEVALLLTGAIKGGDARAILQFMERYASPEQIALWKEIDILPRSAMEEVFEALHLTTLGSCSDWRQLLQQEMKTALAYCYGALLPACLGQEILYGIPEKADSPVQVNYGVLGEKTVNILISGHSPVFAESLVNVARSPVIKEASIAAGADRIVLAGSCCTGNALLSRHGIPSVANILALEMVAATGAVDALVLDMQCAIPGLQAVLECFGGKLITTCAGNRFPRDHHIPLPEPYSVAEAERNAEKICRLAIDNFKERKNKNVFIPEYTAEAVYGWGKESFFRACGGVENLLSYLEEGKIRGIVSIGGCNSPKVPYEFNHVKMARDLIEYGALVFTSGCASYSLLNAGLASPDSSEAAFPGLKEVCRKHGFPPVLPIGACTDNFRLIQIYNELAAAAGRKTCEMPFCHSGPAPGSEKNVGQGLAFLLHGVSVHQGFPGGIPVPIPKPVENPCYVDDFELDINDVALFFTREIHQKLGARVYVEPYPNLAAKTIQMHLHRQRLGLGWRS